MACKISEKFKNPSVEGISFCKIAEKAHSVGRDELAIKVCIQNYESFKILITVKIIAVIRVGASDQFESTFISQTSQV